MFTLINLSKVGLLTTTTGSTTKFYSNLRKKLKLAAPCGECNAPTDFSFVHNDYAPFSVRLVEHYARKNGSWKVWSRPCALARSSDSLTRLPLRARHRA